MDSTLLHQTRKAVCPFETHFQQEDQEEEKKANIQNNWLFKSAQIGTIDSSAERLASFTIKKKKNSNVHTHTV